MPTLAELLAQMGALHSNPEVFLKLVLHFGTDRTQGTPEEFEAFSEVFAKGEENLKMLAQNYLGAVRVYARTKGDSWSLQGPFLFRNFFDLAANCFHRQIWSEEEVSGVILGSIKLFVDEPNPASPHFQALFTEICQEYLAKQLSQVD